ncbi:MAG: AAA family ATPase [Chlamydiia bacterium]
MTHQIIGREKEIKTLQRLLESPRPEFLAIYGRRRVGKTYLIHEYYRDKGVYFCITGRMHSNKKTQIRDFYYELKNRFSLPDSVEEPKDWDEALILLKEAVEAIDPTKKVIIFFDELPWLASPRSGFLSALEHLWNQYLSHLNNVLLIVCGSAAHWIIKKIVCNKGGLYGRLSEVIKLGAFTLEETEKFLLSHNVKLSRKALVELYMTIGGIAKYLTYVHPGESVAQTVNRLCFTPQGQLVSEFQNLYQSLFDSPQKHIQIVRGLAEKRSGVLQRELLEKLKIPSGGGASLLIEELQEAGFIGSSPEFHKRTKDKRLWLIDEYSYFYLTWIEPIKEGIVLGNDPDYWLKMQQSTRWKSWSGYAFESLCLKHVAQIKRALGIAAVLTSESQWAYRPRDPSEKGAQIDLIIDRGDDCINLCEIKFCHTTFTIDAAYARELERKIAVFREQTKTRKTIFLTMITPYGVHRNEYATELVSQELTMEDLF